MTSSLIVRLAMFAVCLLPLIGCGHPVKQRQIDYLPVKLPQQQRWSMYGHDGKFLFENLFENQPSAAIEGVFSVDNGNFYSLYEALSEPKVIPGCDSLSSVGYCQGGLIPVSFPGSRITIINKSGKHLFELEPIDGKEIVECDVAFNDGMLLFSNSDRYYGYVDASGKVVVKPQYKYALPFSEGYAIVRRQVSKNGQKPQYKVIDRKGNVKLTINAGYTPLTFMFKHGCITVKDANGRVGFLSVNGDYDCCPQGVEGIGQYNEEVYAYMAKNGRWGVKKRDTDKTIIEPEYATVELVPDGAYLVEDPATDRFEVLDRYEESKFVLTRYPQVKYIPGFGYSCTDSRGVTLRNKNGRKHYDEAFSKLALNTSAAGFVRSDKYNPGHVVLRIVREMTENSIGDYVLGTRVTDYLHTPLGFEWKDSFPIRNLIGDVEGYKIEYKGLATENISVADPDGSNIEFNPNARLKGVAITMTADENIWDATRMDYAHAFDIHGFNIIMTLSRKGRIYRLYQTPSTEVLTVRDPEKHSFFILLMSGREASKYIEKEVVGSSLD